MMHDPVRILIVDDEPGIVQSLSIRLRAKGFEVICADNGEAGLALASDESPSLILLDIRMPGMDGFEVLRHLKRLDSTREIPVIALSANAVEKSRTQVLSLGAAHFMEKPFDGANLVAMIESLLAITL